MKHEICPGDMIVRVSAELSFLKLPVLVVSSIWLSEDVEKERFVFVGGSRFEGKTIHYIDHKTSSVQRLHLRHGDSMDVIDNVGKHHNIVIVQ